MLDNCPLVSVIIPAYNCERYIRQSLESITNQTYSNIEILISDDASKDRTKKIIDSIDDNRIKRFHNDTNMGYLKTWNKLMQRSKGAFITFQDADDFSELNRIELLLSAFDRDQDLGAVGSNFARVDKKGECLSRSNFSLSKEDIMNKIPSEFDMLGSGIMIRREVFNKIGGYNDFFNRIGAEDYYWFIQIMKHFKYINIPEHLYSYRSNESSVSGNLADNPEKLISLKLVQLLYQQQLMYKTDGLCQGEGTLFEELWEKRNLFRKTYNSRWFFYQTLALRYFNSKETKKARKYSFLAYIHKPYSVQLLREFLYIIRH